MAEFGHFYLDQEKDIVVDLDLENGKLMYTLRTPNHHTGNLITNLASLCDLPLSFDEQGLKQICGTVPCYVDDLGQRVYIFRLGGIKCASIYEDGKIVRKASIPAISKTLMSQTKNYQLDLSQTIVKSYILEDHKFRTDLHTHMNANLQPDILIALGLIHQVRYPLYYIKKLGLKLSPLQEEKLDQKRKQVAAQFQDCGLTGKYLDRKIDDNTEINFADLILNNLENAEYNLPLIRNSLSVMKDGQAVFTNLEKVYLYRYIFSKGTPAKEQIVLHDVEEIPDHEIRDAIRQMIIDDQTLEFNHFSLIQDKLLWIARMYQENGIVYSEISDTGLVKKDTASMLLEQIHEAMPVIYAHTGVRIRFLAALRRIPLAIVKDQVQNGDYQSSLETMRAVAMDPYIAGSDILGEEINDIRDLKPVIRQLVRIARDEPSFVIRIHAGENDGIRDNVLNSVLLVEDCLEDGQQMPNTRIGHGLYTANLSSSQGKKLLQKLKEDQVIVEFQITSNVRLNNLSRLSHHPLKAYLEAGVACVQGTDGGGMYGSDSFDEQFSLEKLLKLNGDQFKAIRKVEDRIIDQGNQAFEVKMDRFMKESDGMAVADFYSHRIAQEHIESVFSNSVHRKSSLQAFASQIRPLPEKKIPVILLGGSFNSDRHQTKMTTEGKKLVSGLLRDLDPEKYFFVIGHALKAYERFLVQENKKLDHPFEIFVFVPGTVDSVSQSRLKESGLPIRVSLEPEELGIYKSVTYEIFKRRPYILIGLDGNSAALNMIQDAKNAKYRSPIFLYGKVRAFKVKAASLSGYIRLFDHADDVLQQIQTAQENNNSH